MANAEATFREKAPAIMSTLMTDFPGLTIEDSAAILGNLGHECMGFTKLQEMKPTVKGSKGGYGWAQWTGPRRRAYEAFCARTGKDPASDDGNYAFLYRELAGIEGTEGSALGKTRAAEGLVGKVKAFELGFLRAGVKHYPARTQYAEWAMDAYAKAVAATTQPAEPPPQPPPTPIPEPEAEEPEGGISLPRIMGFVIAFAVGIVVGGWLF